MLCCMYGARQPTIGSLKAEIVKKQKSTKTETVNRQNVTRMSIPKKLKKTVDKPGDLWYYTQAVKRFPNARVVELVDSLDSGSSVHSGRAGSTPASRTRENARNRKISGIFLTFCPVFEAQTRPLEPSDNKNDNRICACPDIALYRRYCGKPQVKTGVILPLRGANQLPRPYPFYSRCSDGCRCPAS